MARDLRGGDTQLTARLCPVVSTALPSALPRYISQSAAAAALLGCEARVAAAAPVRPAAKLAAITASAVSNTIPRCRRGRHCRPVIVLSFPVPTGGAPHGSTAPGDLRTCRALARH